MGLSPASLQRRQMNSPKDKTISTVIPGVSIGATNLLANLDALPSVDAENAILKRLWGKNAGAAPFYIMLIDSSTLRANGPTGLLPVLPNEPASKTPTPRLRVAPLEVAAGFEFNMDFSAVPLIFREGISVCASSTPVDLTLIALSSMVCTMQYADRR